MGLFALSPVSFMISGYHGNFDPLLALGVLVAAAACLEGQAALCGLAIGLTCQVKIIPVLLTPVFFFFWLHRGGRNAIQFSAVAAVTLLIGWIQPLVTIPGIYLRNVLGYGSVWGVWGLTYLLRLTGVPELSRIAFTALTPAQTAVVGGLKLVVIAGIAIIAWRRRKEAGERIFATLALAWAIFFVFAPGFGAQYLIWPAASFLLFSERWYAAITAASTISLFAFYNVISHGMPWDSALVVHALAAQWVPWFLLPWAVFAGFLVVCVRPLLVANEARIQLAKRGRDGSP
jgi:uncharacterized membrane protein